MDDEVVKLRQVMRDGFLTPQLHRIERFLLTLTEAEKKIKFSSPEEMSLAQTYHQAWWFRNRLLKSQYPKRKESKKFPQFIFPSFQPQAESYIESLVGADKDMATNLVTPKQLAINMKAAYEFLERKKSDPASTITETGKQSSHRFPYKIPDGTMWKNVMIRFLNDEDVEITIGKHMHRAGFAEMGFADGRKIGTPNAQWYLLKLFAEKGGSLPASDPEAKERYRKQKQLLSERLKRYFGIEFPPFKLYNPKTGYTLKMIIFVDEKAKIKKVSDDFLDEDTEVDGIFAGFSGHIELDDTDESEG